MQQLYLVTSGNGKGGKGCKTGGKGAAFIGKCYDCGEAGHWKAQCPKLEQKLADEGQ